MRICIHRGAEEIGGNCVEIEAQGARIVLDLGRPLSAGWNEEVAVPPIDGLGDGCDSSLLGVVISHPHLDHWGLVPNIASRVPVFMGEAASRILREAAFFSTAGADLRPTRFLQDQEPLELGPFRVTPYLVDHSAFDAYALLVEADRQRVFYTGDLRAHGRKGALFDRLLRVPPQNVDVLLMEGTNIRPDGDVSPSALTEDDVERRCIEAFKETPGMALVVYSGQNVDRLVTLYRAALQADRDFVMDLYTATIARATGRDSIPQPGPRWPRVRVFVPLKQRIRVKEAQAFARVQKVAGCRLYPEHLAEMASRLVMTFRSSMARELEQAHCLEGARTTWSLWSGYLQTDRGFREFCDRHGLPIEIVHSSGHAHVGDLSRFVHALAPRYLIPMHTASPSAVGTTCAFPRTLTLENGSWWAVGGE